MDSFHWSQQREVEDEAVAVFVVSCSKPGSKRGKTPATVICKERKMWKGVVTSKPAREKCVVGLSLGREREEERAALMCPLNVAVGGCVWALGGSQLCRAHWTGLLAHLGVCLNILSHIIAKDFFPQCLRLRQLCTYTWAPQVDRTYTNVFQEARRSWLFRALLSGCNNTELFLKAFLNP